jgi:hypothetical protein
MKAILGCTALALAIAMATLPANAKGCIKGAIIGGAAGHVAGHHGLMGAAAGCVIGHHEAKKNEKAIRNPRTERGGRRLGRCRARRGLLAAFRRPVGSEETDA